jgi:hypothetical protein
MVEHTVEPMHHETTTKVKTTYLTFKFEAYAEHGCES